MAEPNIHESWHPVLERHRELSSDELVRPEQKETLRQAVREHVDQARQTVSTASPQQVAVPQQKAHSNEDELMQMDADRQTAFLARMAVEEGIEPAVKLAQRLDSPFVLDELHDFIADKLLEALLRKNRFV